MPIVCVTGIVLGTKFSSELLPLGSYIPTEEEDDK